MSLECLLTKCDRWLLGKRLLDERAEMQEGVSLSPSFSSQMGLTDRKQDENQHSSLGRQGSGVERWVLAFAIGRESGVGYGFGKALEF